MPSAQEIRVVESAVELFQVAAAQLSNLAAEAVRDRGRFTVALSGGSTPKGLYTLLASGVVPVPWDKICFFWGDERHVPPTDPESNYRMANEAMLSKVPAQPQNVFRIFAEEKDARIAADKYEKTIIEFFNLAEGEMPRLDLVLLGIGSDGHTASLFPGSAGLNEKHRLVIANWVEKFNTDRITLTLPVLNHAATVMFLVSGMDKADTLHQVLEGDSGKVPSQLIQPEDGKLIWLLDRAAASQLTSAASVAGPP